MKCLVAGGAGFIGSHLCEKLLQHKNEVLCVDNLLTGSKKNIEHLRKNKHFSFLKHDVIEPLPNIKTEAIFHLASPASPNSKSPMSYLNFPVETLLVNSLGTKNLLDLARSNNTLFLYASTSEVYGDPQVHPQPETYWGNVNPNGIRSCYDEAKRFGESLTMVYHRKYNLNARIIRIFNTYGPRMDPNDGRVIVNFISQALAEVDLTVYGKGSQTRSFCYVDDMVEGLMLSMFRDKTNGEVINLGNPEEYTILKLAKIVKDKINTRSKIIYSQLPEDDPSRRKPDITKAERLFNWYPKTPLLVGLQKTIEYMKKISL